MLVFPVCFLNMPPVIPSVTATTDPSCLAVQLLEHPVFHPSEIRLDKRQELLGDVRIMFLVPDSCFRLPPHFTSSGMLSE
jgi:hypothetical protein